MQVIHTHLALIKSRYSTVSDQLGSDIWNQIEQAFLDHPKLYEALHFMEETGGEPALVHYKHQSMECTFIDCATESPVGRRSLCYDALALESRKDNKPVHSAIELATEMGLELLDENEYRALQEFKKVDLKTSSWLLTPSDIRSLGGAIFGDHRYGKTFIYHNGASSYYAARGFRTKLVFNI